MEGKYDEYVGKVYKQGCSGFVCDILGKPWKSADSFTQGEEIGANGKYNAIADSVVGFKGHVAIYLGNEKGFIDCRGPGEAVRKIKSYGTQKVYYKNY